MPHVAIIGAGPAGCVAGVLLARAGWRVTLVEQHRFPRDKVCGECLSPLGVEVLDRIGLLDAIRSHHPVWLTRTRIHAPGGESVAIDLPAPMLGISRRALDQTLLDAARSAGATVRQPARCERIDQGDRPSVTVRDLESNFVKLIEADWVLLADGKGSLAPPRPVPTDDFGVKTHFADIDGPREAVELFALRRCYGGLAAIEQDRWNAAFAVPRRRIDACRGDIDTLFAEMIDENTALRRRARTARRVSRWLAAPLPRFSVIDHWPPYVIPLGNAAAAVEPIGGEGMGLAMRSAELAAQTLLAAGANGKSPDMPRLRRQFQTLWRTRAHAGRALAVAVSLPRVSDWVVPFIDGSEPFLHDLMHLTGKSR